MQKTTGIVCKRIGLILFHSLSVYQNINLSPIQIFRVRYIEVLLQTSDCHHSYRTLRSWFLVSAFKYATQQVRRLRISGYPTGQMRGTCQFCRCSRKEQTQPKRSRSERLFEVTRMAPTPIWTGVQGVLRIVYVSVSSRHSPRGIGPRV
jgi:hypothetical protein